MSRKKDKVAILGGGISAAYAYAACIDSVIVEPVIITNRVSKNFAGAFWLYDIPNRLKEVEQKLRIGKQEIDIFVFGMQHIYNQKIWENYLPQAEIDEMESSFPDDNKIGYGYNPYKVFDMLLGLNYLSPYPEAGIIQKWKNLSNLKEVRQLGEEYSLVLTSFPTGDTYHMQPPKVLRPMKIIVRELEGTGPADNVVEYWGVEGNNMLRNSTLWGLHCTEYLDEDLATETSRTSDVRITYKVSPAAVRVGSTLRENIYPIGRFASWDRTLMAHDAYEQATTAIWRVLG